MEHATTEGEQADRGDALSQYRQAMDLMDRKGGPSEWTAAVGLFESALELGHAPAAERLATFNAMLANGGGGPSHFDKAFDHLVCAAELGSESAGRQLLLLADRAEPESPVEPDTDFWRAVRSRIRVETLLQSPERTSLSDAPRIRAIEGFATPAECRWLIDVTRERMKPATIFDQETGAEIEDPARNNSAISLLFRDMDVIVEILRTRISRATRVPVPVFEPTQILRYEVGQEFRPHHDFLDSKEPGFREHLANFGQRIATFLIFLNEDFEGGVTEFPKIGLRHRGRTGDALFWANVDMAGNPDPLTLHAGRPPTSGEKWVFSQWIRERLPPPPA